MKFENNGQQLIVTIWAELPRTTGNTAIRSSNPHQSKALQAGLDSASRGRQQVVSDYLVRATVGTAYLRHRLAGRLCNRTRACLQQLHDSTARSHGAGPSTTLTHLRPAHAFKPRWQGPPLSLGQRRALIFRAPDLAQVQYRFLSRSSSCPLPLPRPTAHGPRPSDPPFAPTGTGLRP